MQITFILFLIKPKIPVNPCECKLTNLQSLLFQEGNNMKLFYMQFLFFIGVIFPRDTLSRCKSI